MLHVLNVPAIGEWRVHHDPVIAGLCAVLRHAHQLRTVVIAQAIAVLALQTHSLAAHAATAAHDTLCSVRRTEGVAKSEERARLQLCEVVCIRQVKALELQQLAAFARQLHHIRPDTGFSHDGFSNVTHAGGWLQHGHTLLNFCSLQH